MDHCKGKKRHRWKAAYGVLHYCEVCGKVKMWKKSRGGAFGKCKINKRMFNMRVYPRHLVVKAMEEVVSKHDDK